MSAQAPPACGNCGERVAARYCPDCGQALAEPRAGFRVLVREFFEGVIGYDSALKRTLVPLFLRPGMLTRDYLEGRRHRYYSPLRFYLFCSVIMFLLLDLQPQVGQDPANDAEEFQSSVNLTEGEPFDPDSTLGGLLNEPIMRQVEHLESLDPEVLEVVMLYQAAGAVPKALFLLLPLVALFMRLLLAGTGALYFDHFIFTLHAQSFLFLSVTVLNLFLAGPTVGVLMVPVLAVYWYAGMRRTYGIGRLRAACVVPTLGILVLVAAVLLAAGVFLWAFASI